MNCRSFGAWLVAGFALLVGFDVHASCEPFASKGAVIYGGASPDKPKGAGLICDRKPPQRAAVASSASVGPPQDPKSSNHEADREASRLILDRELSTTKRQLEELRSKGDEWTEVERQVIHRLEADVQALQRELVRHQSK